MTEKYFTRAYNLARQYFSYVIMHIDDVISTKLGLDNNAQTARISFAQNGLELRMEAISGQDTYRPPIQQRRDEWLSAHEPNGYRPPGIKRRDVAWRLYPIGLEHHNNYTGQNGHSAKARNPNHKSRAAVNIPTSPRRLTKRRVPLRKHRTLFQ